MIYANGILRIFDVIVEGYEDLVMLHSQDYPFEQTYRYAFLISSCEASGLMPKVSYNLVSATMLRVGCEMLRLKWKENPPNRFLGRQRVVEMCRRIVWQLQPRLPWLSVQQNWLELDVVGWHRWVMT